MREQFSNLAKLVADEVNNPTLFEPFHEAVFKPFDYYQFGLDFMNVLVDHPVIIKGEDNLASIAKSLKDGHNVVLFANHQTEPDPQLISIALKDKYPDIAKNMIFVAGERVVTDPLAIPFSKGRNLLCIYSKRYIDHPQELKLQKQLHNKKTMEKMSELLKEGGKIIYVAPSGGRDRKDQNGKIQVAPFDAQSLEMFILMAKRAKTPTYFHTLALSTYNLLPPPESIQIELGEERMCHKTKIGFYFGEVIDLEKYADIGDKHTQREKRAQDLTSEVISHYQSLL
jgi:glycerol-3-phosphate O-acyltransferase